MQKDPKRIVIVFCLFLFCFLFSFTASGQERKLEVDYPEFFGIKLETVDTSPAEYIKYFFTLSVIIAGFIFFGTLIHGGIKYLISGDNLSALMDAREQIIAGFVGIAILLLSYMTLTAIDPQLAIVKLPELRPLEFIKPPADPLDTEILASSIDAELPLGRIIEERIFGKDRMDRIKENAVTTLEISEKLEEQSEELKELTEDCCCGNTECDPEPGCVIEGDSCSLEAERCTCDPCKPVRNEIEAIQQKNLEEIEKLKEEQAKTIEETKQLKFELGKLERLETYFVQDCRLWALRSLPDLLIKASRFREIGFLRQIKVWDDISSVYWDQDKGDWIRDWITFYCQVGGTTFFEQPPQPALEDPSPDIPEMYIPQIESCPMEAPIGEIIDRTKRITGLLITRLEQLNDLQGEMIRAIDRMHSLVSQCSSVRCFPDCEEERNEEGELIACICVCKGTPCPYAAIGSQLKEIERIREEIEDTVLGVNLDDICPTQLDPLEIPEQEIIGIVTIIEEVVLALLEDMEEIIWYPMKECVTAEADRSLFDIQRVIGAFDPEGYVIRTPCYEEPAFDECLEDCFLERGHESYRECLKDCLDENAEKYNFEQISWCRHLLNFYCCNVEWELIWETPN